MSENNENQQEQKPAEKTQAEQTPAEKTGIEKAEAVLKKFEEREKALSEKESKLNAMLEDIEKKQNHLLSQGIGNYHTQKSEDEKAIEMANNMLEGSGFSFRDEEFDAFAPKKKK